MLELTAKATQHLLSVRSQRGHGADAAARFIQRGNGVGLTFATEPRPGDAVVEADGISVYVAAEVADRFEAGVIDVGDKGGTPALFFSRRARRGAPANGDARQPAGGPRT